MKTPLVRMATKDFSFEIKEFSDEAGTFTGLASVYDVVDLGNDLVEAGSFNKNLKDKGPERPILWQHKPDSPIGIIELTDTAEGLAVKGILNLDIQLARDAYSNIKKGIIKGLSIGYRTVKSKMQNGVRHLKEIELFEISIVTFPMLPVAQIDSVKGATEGRTDFVSELAVAQALIMQHLMKQALDRHLASICADADREIEDVIQESSDAIDQFKASFLGHLPQHIATMNAEAKVGRRHSSSDRVRLEEAISKLQALLAEEAVDTAEEVAAVNTPEVEAATPSAEPVIDHSLLETFRDRLREAVAA